MAAQIREGVQYALDVINDRIDVCTWTKKSCERFLYDLETEVHRPFYFCEDSAQHVLDFFDYLEHSKGEWEGEIIKLEPWQTFILINIFGFLNRSNDTRRFRNAHIEIPRKNGKTTLAAGIGLYMMVADGEGGPEIYAAACKRDQAKLCFGEASRMAKKSKNLRQLLTIHLNNMCILDSAAKFEPLSSDYNSLDGLNPHCNICDETHAWPDWKLWNVLRSALGSRSQPLTFEITTAGFNVFSVAYQNREYLFKILEGYNKPGGFNDDTMFGIVYTIDKEDDWTQESSWKKANPNYGISVKPDYIAQECKMAIEIPSQRPNFMTKHLNIWTQSEERWIPIEAWDDSGEPFDEKELEGRACFAAADLSSKLDLTCYLLMFPPIGDEKHWKFLCRSYCPEDGILERTKNDKVPYDVWAKDGYLTAIPGSVVDYKYLIRDIQEDAKKYKIKAIGYDPWSASQFAIELEELGFKMIEIRQGIKSMSEASKEWEGMIFSKLISHNCHPVLRWCVQNVIVRKDVNANYMPDKAKSNGRIDLVVSSIMCVVVSILEIDTECVYETRGILTF